MQLIAHNCLVLRLFRYYLQSGSSLSPRAFQDATQGRQIAFQIGAQLGCTATDSATLRQCLRDVTTEELYAAGEAVSFHHNYEGL